MSKNAYQDLYQTVKLLYTDKSVQFLQTEANQIWSRLKEEAKTDVELHNLTCAEIKKIKEEAARKKLKYTTFFLQVSLQIITKTFSYSATIT